LLPAAVSNELKLNYVDCEACIHTPHNLHSFNSFETPAGSNLGEHFQIL